MIESILNSVIGSKLVLIETPIFFKPIENIIKQKSVKPEVLYLSRGQIVKFLKQNFPWINEHTANNIEIDCRDSFDYAAMCAEYYKAGEKVTDLPNIISWKTARYINDIASRNRSSIEDVEYVINLLSMITPIDWDNDRKYFLKEFPNLCDTI